MLLPPCTHLTPPLPLRPLHRLGWAVKVSLVHLPGVFLMGDWVLERRQHPSNLEVLHFIYLLLCPFLIITLTALQFLSH